ncbi:unnamed protein product [Linum tenue]|uniref:Uncharacterized protein n=1 Tax=Linum tenue TaxID=586396 RepID=A0AAV0GVL1_9ROSI|nr:unnamed protein product [Linum tenue]
MGPTHPLPHRRLPLVEVRRDEGLGAGGVEESLPRLQCQRTHCRVQRRGHQGEAGESRRALLHQRS